ncbi:ribonuclease H protein, partial [Trifolium medium]|nr:ribonuclease H protein [Trifolium medium]
GTALTERLQLPQQLWPRLTAPAASYIHNGAWHIPDCIQEIDPSVAQQIWRVILPVAALPDRLIWCNSKDGQLSAKQATLHLSTTVTVPWAVWLWKKSVLPSNSFVVWRIIHSKMPTDKNLIQHGCIVVSVCPLCLLSYETTEHLFLFCSFALQLWNWLAGLLECVLNTNSDIVI